MTRNQWIHTSIVISLSLAAASTAFAQEEIEFDVADVTKAEEDARKARDKDTKGGSPDAVKAFLGDFKFGMTSKEVMAVVTREITERYDKEINSTMDTYKQDHLRKRRDEEIERVKKTLVEFKGKRSGWDASIIDDQIAHGTEESMLVSWEASQGRSQRRFFFFKGKLYKLFLTLDMSAVDQDKRSFALYKDSLMERFGKGMEDYGLVRWNIGSYRVEAIDKLAFYTSFCMAIIDRKTLRTLEPYRQKHAVKLSRKTGSQGQLVEEDPDAEIDLNGQANPLDKILD